MREQKQIVENIDKKLEEKDNLELVKVVIQEIEQEEPYTKIPMPGPYLVNMCKSSIDEHPKKSDQEYERIVRYVEDIKKINKKYEKIHS